MLGNVERDSFQLNLPPFGAPYSTRSTTAPGYLTVGEHRLLPVGGDTKPLFDRYAQAAPSLLADSGFANNFIWFTHMSGFYQVIDDCFCLFALRGNRLGMLLPPLGKPEYQPLALQSCFAIMDRFNTTAAHALVEFVEPSLAARLGGGSWELEPTFPDYLYRTEDLIELRGNAFKTKRSEINQFLRQYPNHSLEPLGPQHWAGVRTLLGGWLRWRIQALDGPALTDFIASAELERLGIERAMQYYAELGLSGLCLLVDGQVVGFTFGERINNEVASVLVEKTDFAFAGAAQYLFREFARSFADCTYLNAGDDLGLENLRRVKMSYRPVAFGEKFTLRRAI